MGNNQSSSRPRRLTPQEIEKTKIGSYTDLAGAIIGGRVVECSDEFFSKADNLIKPSPPDGKLRETENGPQRDGWETRRHSKSHEWAIIHFGFNGTLAGFDIDTSYYNGDHAYFAAVDACYVGENGLRKGGVIDYQWQEILPKVTIDPSTHNVFSLPTESVAVYDHVRLRIYPDGGVARLRVFGNIVPVWGPNPSQQLSDLAFVGNGGRVVSCSDEYQGAMGNLILPGRGTSARNGWLTKRSWSKYNKEWAVIHLGSIGTLEKCQIDTNWFKGNYPQEIQMEGCYSMEERPEDDVDITWTVLLDRTKLGPHAEHFFTFDEALKDTKFTHVRVIIYPDGGLSRVRIFGRPSQDATANVTLRDEKPASSKKTIATTTPVVEKVLPDPKNQEILTGRQGLVGKSITPRKSNKRVRS